MHKITEYFVKASLFTIRYFVYPLIIAFSLMFFLLTIPVIATKSIDYIPFVHLSLLFGLLFSTPIFAIQIGMKVTTLLGKRFERKGQEISVSLLKYKPSIKTRLQLKKYFLFLAISMLLIAFVLIGNAVVTREGTEPVSLNFGIGYIFVVVAMVCMQFYQVIYKESERALSYLEKSIRYIDNCLEGTENKPDAHFFGQALKSYEKTMPSFSSIRHLNDRIKQTELVLKLGTKEEIIAVRDFMKAFAQSIRERDEPAFYDNLAKLNLFLEKFVEGKKETIKLRMVSNREVAKKSFIEAVKPIWNKVVPFLILIAILALIYVLFGVNLAKFLGLA